MDRFAALKAFVTMVDAGGFAPAARRMGLATSSVTRQVDALEAKLAVKLVNRSTRSVTLTDAGQGYYEKARRLLGDLEEADLSVAGAGDPRGLLRVSAPPAFGRLHLAPMLADYLRLFPEVTLDLLFTDAIINLVEENVDVAIRLGALESSSLVARKLAEHSRVICASPAYLERAGIPQSPQDLAGHDCLTFAYRPGADHSRLSRWHLEGVKGTAAVEVTGPVRANSSETLVRMALCGLGLIMMPTWLVGSDLHGGRLRRVLADWQVNPQAEDTGIYAVYLDNRRGVPKLRSFLDFLAERWSRAAP
ncbi:LysR family transcriptional regulator [Pelagibius litoralis]|uniref:LysR family transcriptional regulator n=1 Tax=Pelagibius litoralis TaxID=374515 RepID=A0A967KB02_9PROT|nr:LysR family transcriptional regulator [Pelagibius litoralis]NIA71923.1 LysR family transcriptional regulator [Pelagibius litoralis]